MADIDTSTIDVFYPTSQVHTQEVLDPAEDWIEQPHLYVDRLHRCANGIDECTLTYHFGPNVKQPSSETLGDNPTLALQDQFIRVSIDTLPAVTWYGVIIDDHQERRGAVAGVPQGGVQMIKAVGLEYFLGRRQIDTAVIYDGLNEEDQPQTARIDRPMVFNGGSIGTVTGAQKQRGNKEPDPADTEIEPLPVPVFENGQTEAEEWSARETVEHILEYHAPRDSAGNPLPHPWVLDDDSRSLIEGFAPKVPTENRTPLDIINTVVSPRRGYCWLLQYETEYEFDAETTGPAIVLYINTMAASTLSLPSGGELPANTNQISLDFDADQTVTRVETGTKSDARYDQVRFRGARMTSTLTLGFGDETLQEDWHTDLQDDYNLAGSGETGYSGFDETKKKKFNDAIRREERFYRVYSAFRLPFDWDSKCGDGGGIDPEERNWAFPVLGPTGSIIADQSVCAAGLRVLGETRLQRGWTYADASAPINNDPADTSPEFDPPFVIVEVSPAEGETPSKYQFTHALNQADRGDGGAAENIKVSYHLYAMQNIPGIRLKHAGGMPHSLAKNWFDGAEPSSYEPEVDYETLRVTLTLEADSYCEGVWPEEAPEDTLLEVLTVYVGDEYRLDFLPANTIIALDAGVPTLTNGGILRDDRKKLQDAARLAYEWYKQPRNTFECNWGRVAEFSGTGKILSVGSLITTIGSGTGIKTINNAIESITLDLERGAMEIRTFNQPVAVGELV